MAIEIEMTKEIGNYEPKFIGPFTIRQTVCLSIAAPVCILIYITLSPILTGDVAGFFCIIPAAIAAAFGWLKPYGMKAEEFVRSIFINIVVAPSNRKYIITNECDVISDTYIPPEQKTVTEHTENDTENKTTEKQNRNIKKDKKKKYKLSGEAVR